VGAPSSYDYALIRVVPSVEREEFVNAGVIVFARTRGYLGCAVELDRDLVQRLAPGVDLAALAQHLEGFRRVCAGDPLGGPVALLPIHERFHWLVAARSTSLQPGPVHVGVSDDPAAALAELFRTRVGRARPAPDPPPAGHLRISDAR
jgi:enterochelin esterase-like enzyme